ncbi:MAG: iron ABC transporter substrate-binding protein [Tepidiformaceae bacterium]
MYRLNRRALMLAPALVLTLAMGAACGGDDDDEAPTPSASNTASAGATATGEPTDEASGSITLYSGRNEALVGPLIEMFEEETGIDVEVRYAGTTELATLLLEEGDASPADVFLAQDAGALGAVSAEDLFEELPEGVLDLVGDAYRAADGTWVGVSGRARVIVYNPDSVPEADLPDSVMELTDPAWSGQVGWAPTNASFHTFVTLLRELEGDDAAEEWLADMKANGAKDYASNGAIVTAVAAGEIKLGLVNHYYLWGFVRDQGEGFKARNHFTKPGDPGSFVNVAGAGVLAGSDNMSAAMALLEYMLSDEGQTYFAEQTFEYPLVEGIDADPRFPPLDELEPPEIDLSELADLEGTLELLRSAGILQ